MKSFNLKAIKYFEDNIRWYEEPKRFVIVEKFEYRFSKVCIHYGQIEYFKFFNKDGELHRNNGNPSVIMRDVLMWHKNGKFHRKHGKPAIVRSNIHDTYYPIGSEYLNIVDSVTSLNKGFPIEEYFIDGLRHRDFDLPAVVYDENHAYWFVDGVFHREFNKPAIINGDFSFYYKNGKKYKEDVFYKNKVVNWIIKNPIIISIVSFVVINLIIAFYSWLY